MGRELAAAGRGPGPDLAALLRAHHGDRGEGRALEGHAQIAGPGARRILTHVDGVVPDPSPPAGELHAAGGGPVGRERLRVLHRVQQIGRHGEGPDLGPRGHERLIFRGEFGVLVAVLLLEAVGVDGRGGPDAGVARLAQLTRAAVGAHLTLGHLLVPLIHLDVAREAQGADRDVEEGIDQDLARGELTREVDQVALGAGVDVVGRHAHHGAAALEGVVGALQREELFTHQQPETEQQEHDGPEDGMALGGGRGGRGQLLVRGRSRSVRAARFGGVAHGRQHTKPARSERARACGGDPIKASFPLSPAHGAPR